MKSEILTAVKMSVLIFWADDGGSMFLRNVGINLQVHTALQPRRATCKK
jgi:hypothetical protein